MLQVLNARSTSYFCIFNDTTWDILHISSVATAHWLMNSQFSCLSNSWEEWNRKTWWTIRGDRDRWRERWPCSSGRTWRLGRRWPRGTWGRKPSPTFDGSPRGTGRVESSSRSYPESLKHTKKRFPQIIFFMFPLKLLVNKEVWTSGDLREKR